MRINIKSSCRTNKPSLKKASNSHNDENKKKEIEEMQQMVKIILL